MSRAIEVDPRPEVCLRRDAKRWLPVPEKFSHCRLTLLPDPLSWKFLSFADKYGHAIVAT
jgi:hypothetical protein